MGKWKCGICNSEFNNYQAQGFNGTIYCPLCYFKELYKREKTKNDKAIEFIKSYNSTIKSRNELGIYVDFMSIPKELLEILDDKEQEEYTLTKDENGTTQINGEWYRVDKK